MIFLDDTQLLRIAIAIDAVALVLSLTLLYCLHKQLVSFWAGVVWLVILVLMMVAAIATYLYSRKVERMIEEAGE